MLAVLEFDKRIDERLVDLGHDLGVHTVLESAGVKPLHHVGAPRGRAHFSVVRLVGRSALDVLLALGEQRHYLVVDLVDVTPDVVEGHVLLRGRSGLGGASGLGDPRAVGVSGVAQAP